jgi:hypothetical protein
MQPVGCGFGVRSCPSINVTGRVSCTPFLGTTVFGTPFPGHSIGWCSDQWSDRLRSFKLLDIVRVSRDALSDDDLMVAVVVWRWFSDRLYTGVLSSSQ